MTDEERVAAIKTALLARKHDRLTEHEFEQRIYEIVSPDWSPMSISEMQEAAIDNYYGRSPSPSTLIEHNPEQPVPLLPAPVDRADRE